MKLYTKTGDDGHTSLFGGQRVAKNHPRVEAYGTVDELNAALGLIAACNPKSNPFEEELDGLLQRIQSRLFDLGADLATPEGNPHEDKIHRITSQDVEEVEARIDTVDERNEPMHHFVLPGGTELAARLHLARTICRRAERAVIRVDHSEPVTEAAMVYLNRLSDLLFALARLANKSAGAADVPWHPHPTQVEIAGD